MKVAFVNENMLGHASYLLPFVNRFQEHPELGVTPYLIHATPVPAPRSYWANFSVRGLRKWGLDFGNLRWRTSVSRFVRDQLDRLCEQQDIDAVVVNTQSVALALARWRVSLPLFICLDATFSQLAASRWFAPNSGSRIFLPLTTASLLKRERQVLQRAERLLVWSKAVRDSLLEDYGSSPERVHVLPPSIDLDVRKGADTVNARPQILFVGGDFKRKGGELLLDCYRRWFSGTCDLHLVTQSPMDPEPDIHVHHGVRPFTAAWRECWQSADVFVFPSELETFGIVLVEALAFGVPVISTDTGAARYILSDGRAGLLLEDRRPETLAQALRRVLGDLPAARQRARYGRSRVEEDFDLSKNTQRLATWLEEAVRAARPVSAKEASCERARAVESA